MDEQINCTAQSNGAEIEKLPNKKLRGLFAAITIIISVMVAIAIIVAVWYAGDRYPDFERNFNADFAIPGLDDGLVPQGLGNNKKDGTFFVSGYMKDGGASRVYMVKDGKSAGYVTIKLEDGSVYDGHASGVAANGTNLWVVSDGMVYVLKYSEVTAAAETCGEVTVKSSWNANCNADFCYYDGTSYLYVGEFYKKGDYETDSTHRLETPNGENNSAIILRYSASASSPTAPSYAYSITGKIQGMAIINNSNTIVLSQSYGFDNSHILLYDAKSAKSSSSALKINGSYVTVKYLDTSVLVKDYEVPSMSEALCAVNDKVYVLFESASKKYSAFVREKISNVYTFRYSY